MFFSLNVHGLLLRSPVMTSYIFFIVSLLSMMCCFIRKNVKMNEFCSNIALFDLNVCLSRGVLEEVWTVGRFFYDFNIHPVFKKQPVSFSLPL